MCQVKYNKYKKTADLWLTVYLSIKDSLLKVQNNLFFNGCNIVCIFPDVSQKFQTDDMFLYVTKINHGFVEQTNGLKGMCLGHSSTEKQLWTLLIKAQINDKNSN